MASANTKPASGVQDDLDELTALLGETFRGLKQSSPTPRLLREAAERQSLGPRHLPALLAVAIAGPMSVTELARRLGLGLSTTSAIVGQLSRAGLLERAEDEDDRRRTIVRLHERHREVIGAWAEHALAPLRATLERLPAPARAHFMDGWRILHEEVTRTAPARVDDREA
ncbi:MAG TPA: MarR family transcriptional regulator [Solirubrobacteraceae bacterium]|nr:MarR family transcriptional regulator [Solirubrobacteraceae bacterium]